MLLLNLMLPAMFAFYLVLGTFVAEGFAIPLSLLGVPQIAAQLTGAGLSLVVSGYVAYRWARQHTVPRPLAGRVLLGHRIIAVGTLVGVIVLLGACALLFLPSLAKQPIYTGLGLASMPLVILAWGAGWYLVAKHKNAVPAVPVSAIPVGPLPSQRGPKRITLPLLNLMLPATCAVFYVASFPLMMVMVLLSEKGAAASTARTAAVIVALLVSVLGAYFAVRRHAALPRPLSGKALAGNAVIAIGTVAAIASTVGPFALAYFTGKSEDVAYAYLAMLVIPCSMLLWGIGGYLVGTHKAAA